MRERISRRDFLRWGALAMGGVALASCAPQAAPTAAPAAEKEAEPAVEAQPAMAEGVTVEYWMCWGSYERIWPQMKELDEYKDLIGDMTIEIKPGGSQEVLLTAIAGGTPPEAGSCLGLGYVDMFARDVLLPQDDLIAASSVIKKENYLPLLWDYANWEGKQLGVPANECAVACYALNYNERLVDEAGLDPDAPPTTWEECLEWHRKLTEFDSSGNVVRIGLDPYDEVAGEVVFPPLSWGWEWFDDTTGTFDFANDLMAESYEIEGEFYRIVGPDNLTGMRQVEGQGGWGTAYNSEVQAMIIAGYWHPGETAFERPEVSAVNRATWAPVPASRSGVKIQGHATGGHFLVLFKGSKNPIAAFKISELLGTDAACDVIYNEVGWLPGLKSYLAQVDATAYPGLDFYLQSINEATGWQSLPRCEILPYANEQWRNLAEEVYRDKMTGSQAAEELQRRCESEYESAGFAKS